MSSLQTWVKNHYNSLVTQYAGHWVLIKDNQVIFSDKRFDVVYDQAEALELQPAECLIEFIDSGDAVFYEISLFNPKD